MTAPPQGDDRLARACAAVVNAVTGGGTDGQFDTAVMRVEQLPAAVAERSHLAAELIMALVRTDPSSDVHRLRHLTGLLDIAGRNPPDHPDWPRVRAAAAGFSALYAAANGRVCDTASILADLAEFAADDASMRGLYDAVRLGLAFGPAFRDGDESTLSRFPDEVAKLGGPADGNPEATLRHEILIHVTKAAAANQRGDYEEMWRAWDAAQRAIRDLPAGDFMHRVMADATAMVNPLRGLYTESGDADPGARLSDDQWAALLAMANRPEGTDADRAARRLAAGAAALRGGQETDIDRIEAGIKLYRDAVACVPPDDPQRAFYLQSLALGLLRRAEVRGGVNGLAEAEDLLHKALGMLGGPRHPQWSLANEILTGVHTRLGQYAQAVGSGLDGQRSYAFRVLLQSDVTGAKIAIRRAAGDALDAARRCLGENDPAAAITALDSGRGLLLFAATVLRDAVSRLTSAGRADLAGRWEAAQRAGAVPEDLRKQVMSVLVDTAGNLLDPPSVPDIQAALAALDADALVYLVPGESPIPGWAVIAPARGAARFMALPDLAVHGDVQIEAYLRALARRSAEAARDLPSESTGQEFGTDLAAVCDWAWRVAIGPLLRSVADWPVPASRTVPRIVLVPVGDLARIPWQAARRAGGRYAVEDAAFSYTPSARMLCESASRSAVRLSATGLVVGDPDTAGAAATLDAARQEAHCIRDDFYAGARYLGRRPDGSSSPSGRGTADQVRRWLADTGPGAGAMLHLACHAFAAGPDATGANEARAYLALSPDEAQRDDGSLSAAVLAGVLSRAIGHDVGLVVLAACNSGRSVHGYDEVYSLGTAFLVGGTRTVLSTQWSIPDAATSSLMYMVHHFLRRKGMPPWQALRAAQLWMIDPDRCPPDRMPATVRPGPAAASEIAAWAAFIHWGQ